MPNLRTLLRLVSFTPLLAGCTGGDDSGEVAPTPSDYGSVVAAAGWATDMTVSLVDDVLTLEDDGVPDHDVLEAYALMDGTTTAVGESPYSTAISMAPVYSDSTTETGMGSIGVAVSGGLYFNPYEGDGTSIAVDSNFDVDGVPFLDACNAHPLPTGGDYHYHGVPYCITDEVDVDGSHSTLIGALLDGFPVYGPSGEGGAAPGDLDACSGHSGATPEFPDGVYHYHLTETAPYSITCYHGEVESSGSGPPP